MLNELINDIEKLIEDYYADELKTYKFKSADDEESIWTMVDELKEDISSMLHDGDFQIECELSEATKYVPDRDIIELDKYRI